MPKTSTYTLCWLPEQVRYELRERGKVLPVTVSPEGELWHEWLAAHSALAFQGRQGKLTLLKEKRARGEEGYWYAYRKHHNKQSKQYIGTTAKLSPDSLEQVAAALQTKILQGSNRKGKEAIL